jgi:hypothetical protein
MNRTRSFSADETFRPAQPVAPEAVPASAKEVNALGIRILALKSIPVQSCARITAFLACASDLQGMPQRFVPLLAGELRVACATLPTLQQRYALNALDSVTLRNS